MTSRPGYGPGRSCRGRRRERPAALHRPRHCVRCARIAQPPNAAPQSSDHNSATRPPQVRPRDHDLRVEYQPAAAICKAPPPSVPASSRSGNWSGHRRSTRDVDENRRDECQARADTPPSSGTSAVQHDGAPLSPCPTARSIPSDQTDRTAPSQRSEHKTRYSGGFVFRPPPRRGSGEDPNGIHKRRRIMRPFRDR